MRRSRNQLIPSLLQTKFICAQCRNRLYSTDLNSKHDFETLRTIFQRIEQKLNVERPEDWYAIHAKQATDAAAQLGFGSICQRYIKEYGFQNLLRQLYPEFTFDSFSFQRLQRNNLEDTQTRLEILHRVEKELNITELEQWYLFTRKEADEAAERANVKKAFHSLLANYFNNSLIDALQVIYPNYQWDILKFKRLRNSSLKSDDSLRQVFTLVEKELGIEKPEDWYNFRQFQAKNAAEKVGLGTAFTSMLNQHYHNSLAYALAKLYPNVEWNEFKFKRIVNSSLSNKEGRRKLLTLIEKELGITQPQQWYKYNSREAEKAADKIGIRKAFMSMLMLYSGSLIRALLECFPEYKLNTFMFKKAPRSSNGSLPVLSSMVQHLESRLYIDKLEDWYRVSQHQVRLFSKLSFLQKHGGLGAVLPMVYPNFGWDKALLGSRSEHQKRHAPKKSQQRLLFVFLRAMLGKEEEIYEDHVFPDIKYSESTEPISVDVYLPRYKLGIEYQGQHHYRDIGVFGSFREYQMRDEEKQKKCAEHGIDIVAIPYTWDSTAEGIRSLIHALRPDIPLQPSKRE